MPPINEYDCRRPDFQGGVPIRLEDGQDWHFPKPTVEIRPDFSAADRLMPVQPGYTSWGKEFDDLINIDIGNHAEQAAKWFRVAEFMLRKNYDLGPEILSTLFVYRPDDEANSATWSEIFAVAYGNSAPKASSGGEG